MKHITYRWLEGRRDSLTYNKEMQLPQFEIKGYRLDYKDETTSTGIYVQLNDDDDDDDD